MGTTSYFFGWYLAALQPVIAHFQVSARAKHWVAR
jgi:hypothetical protein